MAEERDGGATTGGDDPPQPGEYDVEALRTTQSEVRAVLDHQIRTFDDLDSKAMRTARLTGVLLGFILTGVTFLAREGTPALAPYLNWFSFLGVGALLLSIVVALLTYTLSYAETGVGPDGVERLVRERYSETEWLVLLLRSEAKWMRANNRRQAVNANLLTASHAVLIVGILLLTAGIAVPILFP